MLTILALLGDNFFPSTPFSVLVCSSQMALWTDRQFLDALGGNPSSALTSQRSGFAFSLWRRFWPLLGIKFLYFMIHGILCVFSPQQFTGLSWGNCQVWRFWKCLEGFYFTAERQFDGLVQKELRFTQLHCLFWLHFLLCQKQRQAVMLISFRHFAVLFFLNLNSICTLFLSKIPLCNWSKPTHFWESWAGLVTWRAWRIRSSVLLAKGMLHSCVPINPSQCLRCLWWREIGHIWLINSLM